MRNHCSWTPGKFFSDVLRFSLHLFRMRIVLLVFLTTLSLASSSHKDLFDHFLKKYSKTYSDVEYHDRLRIFTKNYEYILSNTGKNGTLFAVNEYTDLTLAELRDTKFLKVPRSGSELLFTEMEKKSGALPPSFDWRLKGAVTSVQNQGQMGVYVLFAVFGYLLLPSTFLLFIVCLSEWAWIENV